MTDRPQESDIAFIRALAELLRETDLTEIEVNRELGDDSSLTVRVARQIAMAAPVAAHVAMPAAAMAVPGLPAPAAVAAAPAGDPAEDPGVVASPMVGTVYLQAEPGSSPFVKLGDTVAEGQTILIIEAMKTMNQIPAPRAGRVKRILVEDGSPVEFGAPLIILE
ncbi:MAG: acetyl-CoA carboxylase biotin carboxyl carrier protein [Amaricoccus sp.]